MSEKTHRIFIHKNESSSSSSDSKVLLISDDISLNSLKKLGGENDVFKCCV